MKKIIIYIFLGLLIPFIALAHFQPATLFVETWDGIKKQAVYSQEQADKFFKDGYKLYQELLGASITTIESTDTLKTSRTTINNNFTALNAGKIEVSTTTLPNITTLINLSTVGTIGSGVWSGTAIGVGYGGTGTTSPTSNYVMLGNGSSGLKVVSGQGNSGQFLTSNGVAAAPSWQTSSIDQTQNYTWTGLHIFNTSGFISNASSTLTATTTISASDVNNNALVLNGQAYKFPTSQTSNQSVLMSDGAGTLNWTSAYRAEATNILRLSADTERSTISASYVKVKEIRAYMGGTLRVKFDSKVSAGGTGYGRIYKNGTAFGTEQANAATNYVTYSEDLSFSPEDLIQLYYYESGGDQTHYIQNFRIYFTPTATSIYGNINTN